MMMTFAGCVDRRGAEVLASAQTKGQAQASDGLAPWPADCKRKEPHAPLVSGAEVRSTLDRERDALERQWDRTDYCAAFYEDQRDGRAR